MPTASETRLAALAAVLSAAMPAGAAFGRNIALPTRIPGAGAAILRDGEPGEPEVTMSPILYLYEHRAELDIVTAGAARNATLDAMKAAVGVAIAADRTLGGLCDYMVAEAPAPVDLPGEGGEEIKAATVAIVLIYAVGDPLS